MSAAAGNSFVLFPLGSKRFALPASQVAELAMPDRLQEFPQTTTLLTGVVVRRGHIVPVCDIAHVLVGPKASLRKFYLIAVRGTERAPEWIAIPVSGECELAKAEMLAGNDRMPKYVMGLLSMEQEIVEVVDLEKLISSEVRA